MADNITHLSSHMDLQGNSAVTVATDAGRVFIHYRHLSEWIELPPVPGTKAAAFRERVSEEARTFYDAGYKDGDRDRANNREMLTEEYNSMPIPWRTGYNDGKAHAPHKYTKEVSTK